MKKIVFGTRESKITAKKVAKEINAEYCDASCGVEGKYTMVFRYGNSFSPTPTPMPSIIINPFYAIQNASRKLEARQKLLSLGIPAPQLYFSWNISQENLPVIARPRRHMKGRDFHLIENMDKAIEFAKKGYYLQEVIDKDREYRIFVFKDRILEIDVKLKNENPNHDGMIRTHRLGWHNSRVPMNDVNSNLRAYARAAVTSLNLDFGAADCCTSKDGGISIFEVNSAPALIDRKIKILSRYMAEHYGDEAVK